MKRTRRSLGIAGAALLAPLTLVGCDDPVTDPPPERMDEPDGPSRDGQGLNAPLSGVLITNDDEIDLDTGDRTVLENLVGDDRGLSKASGSPDGRYHAIAHDLDCGSIFDECVKAYYRDGSSYEFVVDVSLRSNVPEISPDGSLIIVVGKDDIADTLFRSLIMRVPASAPVGDRILSADVVASRDFARSSAFGPDGSIYYSRGNAVYHMASPLQASEADRLVWRFDDIENGDPGRLSISPDGSQIALERVTRRSQSERTEEGIWIVQSDGSGARSFVSADPINRTLHPKWSPDGRWIVANVSGQTSGTALGSSLADGLGHRLFVFDTSVQNHELGGELLGDDELRFRPKARCFQNQASCRESSSPRFLSGEPTLWRSLLPVDREG